MRLEHAEEIALMRQQPLEPSEHYTPLSDIGWRRLSEAVI